MCEQIIGVDANALYLWCMSRKMPTGQPIICLESNDFTSENNCTFSKTASGWLSYEGWKRGIRIQQAIDGTEAPLGQHALPVDGFHQHSKQVF